MNKLKIGDFVKLTGSTVKTVNYYHKIGLLPEPERSSGGYRLYGAAELDRMLLIKRLKSLGLDLKKIKYIVGDVKNQKTFRELLQSLRNELINEKKDLEERLEKVDALLNENSSPLAEVMYASPSFQMITEILGNEQTNQYASTCPEIYGQHRKLYSILDNFDWGEDYSESFRALAEYFKAHPEKYQLALKLGARWAEIAKLKEDDPRIETFAREAADFVNSMPVVKEIISVHPRMRVPLENLYQEMVAGIISPAQIKYQELFEKFLFEN